MKSKILQSIKLLSSQYKNNKLNSLRQLKLFQLKSKSNRKKLKNQLLMQLMRLLLAQRFYLSRIIILSVKLNLLSNDKMRLQNLIFSVEIYFFQKINLISKSNKNKLLKFLKMQNQQNKKLKNYTKKRILILQVLQRSSYGRQQKN